MEDHLRMHPEYPDAPVLPIRGLAFAPLKTVVPDGSHPFLRGEVDITWVRHAVSTVYIWVDGKPVRPYFDQHRDTSSLGDCIARAASDFPRACDAARDLAGADSKVEAVHLGWLYDLPVLGVDIDTPQEEFHGRYFSLGDFRFLLDTDPCDHSVTFFSSTDPERFGAADPDHEARVAAFMDRARKNTRSRDIKRHRASG